MFTKRNLWFLLVALLVGAALPLGAARAADVAVPPSPMTPTVGYAERMDVSPALRDMPALAVDGSQQPVDWGLRLPKILQSSSVQAPDPIRQSVTGPAAMPAPLASFDGLGNINGAHPPDTQGDIGYDPATGKKYYVQWVNLSFAIWDVTGTPTQVYGPVNGNTLWQGFGGPCETTNHGDPITLFDPIANRWLMSQFSVNGPYYQCIAISQTANPTGAWYRYAFQVSATKMNDYPHFGVWPDGYYMTVNQFTGGSSWGGAGVFVFERSKMLVGDPTASFQFFDLYNVNSNFGGMLPSDLDGSTLPPAGAPNYFAEVDDSTWIGPNDAMRIWEFHVDWANPNNTTFGVNGQPNAVLPVAEWTPLCINTRACIPQPGTTVKLDAIGDRLMYRLAYRNFGDHEALVVNHTVNAGGNLAGVRWYEVRDPGGTPVIYQQGTYAPDSTHRWMGSVAMDGQGNMALGYSVSSSSVYPSVRYTGRLASDPLGTMPQGEASLVVGSGYQTSPYNRWGDYSMLGIDPVDDCTFWYTQEYMATSGYATWSTRIGSFRFPNCLGTAPGTLRGLVRNATTLAPIGGAAVESVSSTGDVEATTSGTDGSYALLLDAGMYTVTARAYGYFPYTATNVEVSSGVTTTLNLPLSPAPTYVVSGTVTDAQTGWPLYARVKVSGTPFNPPAPNDVVWTDPVSGRYTLTLAAGITYTFEVQAWVSGYIPAKITVGPLNAAVTRDVPLSADTVACTAPGYVATRNGTTESFNAAVLPSAWSLVDNAGTGVVWRFDDPKPRGNLTGGTGPFAIIDSDYAGAKNVDTVLRSPALDLSALTTVMLEFKYDFRWYSYGLNEVADVDVSNNGGATWTNVWRRSGANDRGPKTARVNISALAAGRPDVQVRFHYYTANYEWWWQVDDVFVGTIACVPMSGGLVVGEITDANTGAAVAAAVTNDAGYATTASTTSSPGAGAFYTLFAPAGTRVLTATATGYGPAVVTATVLSSAVTARDMALAAGVLAVTPQQLALTLTGDMTATRALTLSNSGGHSADFTVQEVNAPYTPITVTGPFAGMVRRVAPKYIHALTAVNVREYTPPDAPLLDAGAVIQTWDSGLAAPWGIGYDRLTGLLWVGDTRFGGGEDRNVAFRPDGTPTGASMPTAPWIGLFAADLAYNPLAGTFWQVNVGDDNCIYELDAATQTATGRALCPPVGVSQRGLAYDPTTDTFYSGSWSDQILYHFDATGRLLDSYDLKLNIAGLAYNPATRHLFVMSNAATGRDVYVLDVAAGYAVVGGFDIAGLGSLEQAGLALDCDGNLWTVNQATGQVIQAVSGETGVCAWEEIAWLTTEPVSGTVESGGAQVVSLHFDTTALEAGTYPVYLRVANSTPYGALNVPITLTVMQLYGVSLAPSTAARSGLPGASVPYTFTVTNTGSETDAFTVTLSGNAWPATAAATVGPLAGGASASLVVNVTVPDVALCDGLDTLTVTVTSQGNPNRAASATATTSARAVYAVQASLAATALWADPGASVSTALWVTNTGNCVDAFAITSASPWPASVAATTGALTAGAGVALPVTVTVPASALAGDAAVTTLTAKSQANGAISAITALTTTVNAVYGVTLSPPLAMGSGQPGATVLYTLTVANTGNSADTYTLSVYDALWPTTVAPQTAALDPGQTQVVTVTVSVPLAATPTLDTARVVAAGTDVTATTILTTVLDCIPLTGAQFTYTPAQPLIGQTVTFTATVEAGTPPIVYTWDFGDGGIAVGDVVTHTFTAETAFVPYMVVMTATNACSQLQVSNIVGVRLYQVYLPLVMRVSD
ncbi:MAG: carboxypeptidase regulatory-like domain-containing protein [Anaerolineae bacterium]|mgnify:CR=1 FL=1